MNEQVGEIATQVGTSPADFEPRVFEMIRGVSNSAILPIAGVFLTLVACYELVQMVTEHNNLASFGACSDYQMDHQDRLRRLPDLQHL